ncbi:MAG: hypothetical protein VB082_06525 [Christensenella sp.]|nr:hypothetical protein [Christensenella sp.]
MQSKILVLVDNRNGAELVGRIYHGRFQREKEFYDINSMVLSMESVFDKLKHPEASTESRIFGKVIDHIDVLPQMASEGERMEQAEKNVKGNKATFIVQVQYRQNATWQGQVTWSERNMTKHFRSALELIKLIDSATEEAGI